MYQSEWHTCGACRRWVIYAELWRPLPCYTVLDHCCVPLRCHDKRHDSGKGLCYFNFPRDKQKRKRTPSLEWIIYFEYVVYARPASFLIQNGRCLIRVYCVSSQLYTCVSEKSTFFTSVSFQHNSFDLHHPSPTQSALSTPLVFSKMIYFSISTATLCGKLFRAANSLLELRMPRNDVFLGKLSNDDSHRWLKRHQKM